jgi:hypothetical protein
MEASSSRPKQGRKWLILAGTMIGLAALCFVGWRFNRIQKARKAFEIAFADFATECRNSPPVLTKQNTRSIKTVVGPGRRVTWEGTLLTYDSATYHQMTDEERTERHNKIKDYLFKEAAANKDLDFLRNNKVQLVWVFYTSDREEIDRITIQPGEY